MFNTSRCARPTLRRTLVTIVMAVFLPCSSMTSLAQDRNMATGPEVEVNINGVKLKIPDLILRDQDGRKVRLYSDLIKDKVVVLSFFYTSCAYVCTMQGRTFSKLQSLLGERLGKSVFLISVTRDPVKDQPGQLKAWGKRYDIHSGWTLVTGEEAEMNKILIPFTGSPAGEGMHLAATFIGNDKTGLWTSAAGVFAPEDLLSAVDFITR
jgi:protein SCO1/2